MQIYKVDALNILEVSGNYPRDALLIALATSIGN